MKSRAYRVYLLFKVCFSLLFSMATVLSIVYHLEVVGLNPLQLVLVGTALETACFLFEIPTGLVADLYSRRRSVLIGLFLYGAGFLMEGALPWFGAVLLAQVVWGCGDTFITGALEAWIASEEQGSPMDGVFLRGSQLSRLGGMAGVVLGTLLGGISLQLPLILSGALMIALGCVMMRIMPETNFRPAVESRKSLIRDAVGLMRLNLRFAKGAPALLALLGVTLCGGLASEGFDRLSVAHFLNDAVLPAWGSLNTAVWFGLISLLSSALSAAAVQILIVRLEKRGSLSRRGWVMFTSAGYMAGLLLFAAGRNFGFLLVMFLLASVMRALKEPITEAWMNDQVEERLRASVFSANGQMDALGQIVGGPLSGLAAQRISTPWGLACTALFMMPVLLLAPLAERLTGRRGAGRTNEERL
jgi:DHA3 family tetracycline resistance protein-like MFS transporter